MESMPKEVAFIKEGHNEPLVKEGNNKTLAKDGNWLSTTMSPLPQGQFMAYVVQDNDEHLATRICMSYQATISCIRVAYAVQGNNEPS